MNLIKKISLSNSYIVLLLYILSSSYAIFIGSKGFAGFDLSPMISLAQSLHSGLSYHAFIDNPISPGFAVILKFLSYFAGEVSWDMFIWGAIFFSGFFILIASYYNRKSSCSYNLVFFSFLIGSLIPLITDGHLYLHDVSNLIAIFSSYLLYIIIQESYYKKILCLPIFILAFSLVFLFFMRANTGMGFAIINFLILLGYIILDSKEKILIRLKLSFFWVSIVIFTFFILKFFFSSFISADILQYIKNIISMGEARSVIHGSVDHGQLHFNILERSGGKLKENLLYFSQILLILIIFIEIMFYKLCKKSSPAWLLSIIAVFLLLLTNNWKTIPIFLLFLLGSSIFINTIKEKSIKYFFKELSIQKCLIFIWGISGVILSFIIIMQSYDVRSTSLSILILSASIAFSAFNTYKIQDLKSVTPWVIIFIVMLSFEGSYRLKLILAGPPMDRNDYTAVLNNSFFNNHKTSQFHLRYESSIDKFFKDNEKLLKNKNVLFLSRIEYLYAKYDLHSVPGLPLWWHISTSYKKESSETIVKTIISDVDYIIGLSYNGNPDVALMGNDYIYNTINDGTYFIKDLNYSDIVILKNKKLSD